MPSAVLDAIIVPPKSTARSSIIWLHGLGADGNDFVDIIPQLHLPDHLATRFVFPHAPVRSVTANGGLPMRAWFDIYGFTANSQQDEVGVTQAGQMIDALINQELEQGISAHKVVLAGFSQGGALALYAGLCYPKKLAGIMALSTYLPIAHLLQSRISPENRHIPIFMAHGTTDPVLALSLGESSKNLLQHHHYHVDWHTYPMAHSVCPQEIVDISNWLNKVLS